VFPADISEANVKEFYRRRECEARKEAFEGFFAVEL